MNLLENCVILTPGEIITNGSMCCFVKIDKLVINAVKSNVNNKKVPEKLRKDFKSNDSKVHLHILEIIKNLYSILNEYQDVLLTVLLLQRFP